MGRLKKELIELPTAKIRAKIYARIVRMALCHKADFSMSCANLMDGVIKAELDEMGKSLALTSATARKFRESIGNREGSFVSSGRWKNWWDGAKPDPKKIEVLQLLLPQTKHWFSPEVKDTSLESFPYSDTVQSRKSANGLHPLHTLMCAIDLWAGGKECSINAYSMLLNIQNTWRPRTKGFARNSSIEKYGWYISPFPNNYIPYETVVSFRSLEPSSIMQSMLWCGDYLDISNTQIFTRWVFDLISAALVTKALIYSLDIDSTESGQTASDLGGESLDVMGFLIKAFISRYDAYSKPTLGTPILRSSITGLNKENTLVPDTVSLEILLEKSRKHFKSELSIHGIEINQINKLDPWLSNLLQGIAKSFPS